MNQNIFCTQCHANLHAGGHYAWCGTGTVHPEPASDTMSFAIKVIEAAEDAINTQGTEFGYDSMQRLRKSLEEYRRNQ